MRRVSPHAASVITILIGALVGSAADRIPPRPIVRAGGYFVLSGDFHVHAFPGDGALSPWMLRDEAARAGLDVIAVTNHNQSFTGLLAQRVSESGDGSLMLAGQEVTNPDFHMIAAGIADTVDAFRPAAEVIVASTPSESIWRASIRAPDASTRALLQLAHPTSMPCRRSWGGAGPTCSCASARRRA